MRIRSITTEICAGALIAFSAIAAACGSSGDTLSLADYIAELAILDDQYEERTNSLETRFEEDAAPFASDEEAALQLYRELLDDGARAISEFVNGIDALNPPAEAEAIHDRAVTDGRALAAAVNDLVDQLQDVASEADFNAAFESSAIDTVGEAFVQACEDIQTLADANGIDAAFNCD